MKGQITAEGREKHRSPPSLSIFFKNKIFVGEGETRGKSVTSGVRKGNRSRRSDHSQKGAIVAIVPDETGDVEKMGFQRIVFSNKRKKRN